MKIPSIIRLDGEFSESISAIRESLNSTNPLPTVINGLSGGAEDAYLSEAIREITTGGTPVLVLVPSDAERHRVFEYLRGEGIRAMEYKPRDLVFYNISASCDIDRERLSVLHAIISGECDAVVSTPSAAALYTMPREVLRESVVALRAGDEIAPMALADKLILMGFVRVDMVEAAGQFSVRGDIFDIWHCSESHPVRVEFFGDEIDRVAYFNAETQRSLEVADLITVLPVREVIITPESRERVISQIKRLLKKCTDSDSAAKLEYELSTVEANLILNSRDKYINAIYRERETLFDYMLDSTRAALFVVGTNENRENLARRAKILSEAEGELVKSSLIFSADAHYILTSGEYEEKTSKFASVHLNSFAGGIGTARVGGLFGFRCRRVAEYGGNPALLYEDIRGFLRSSYRIIILAETRMGAESLAASLASEDIFASVAESEDEIDISNAPAGKIYILPSLHAGFELIVPRVAVLSLKTPEGRAVMRERKRRRIIKKAGGAGERLMSYADLSVGDYVVHASYGIGLFEGIEAVTIDGVTRDYITIKYAGTDKLFVPCDKLELIGKYIGERDHDGKVKLSKMGGGDWTRAKSRAKAAARDIAKDLIRLYAERQRLPGFAFPKDSDLEDEFAASFEYEETDSQLQAIEEIKADMMRPTPMNRLLCGDVGFGKTEVALRAAFKAIMGGKQVAILVPTTILALQHFSTATSRMRNYPVTVEMISRFRTPAQQEKIIRRVARGEVDVLIGTHKLLSKKISFRDLGLLIIDEEQRFGVAQKEKLRQMAKCVDTLTLSATPIPRTLNMAMNGIADMSILDEAPGDRRPVQTYVLEYDEAVIYDALRREISRGGQVLYLYNKIDDIELVATKIMRELPDARVAVAHGAMDKDELEDIWQSLVRCEIDILVCTTIIETGVDLPLANTLIIENADRMGLSQLHQIRGRVGRSERQAYAYFTYRPGKALTDIARKRLTAIREFATFGAGFKVALRDLEIRGAGNLLGAEQHGYIESVGYDLYIKLLSEAVLEESGTIKADKSEATVDIRISAYILESYIKKDSHRMEMYKKISLISTEEDMQDILDEFIDRFGAPPRECEALLRVSLLRALATEAGMKRVEHSAGYVLFHAERPDLSVWSELFGEYKSLSFRASAASPTVCFRLMKGDEPISVALKILSHYVSVMREIERSVENEGKN